MIVSIVVQGWKTLHYWIRLHSRRKFLPNAFLLSLLWGLVFMRKHWPHLGRSAKSIVWTKREILAKPSRIQSILSHLFTMHFYFLYDIYSRERLEFGCDNYVLLYKFRMCNIIKMSKWNSKLRCARYTWTSESSTW